MNKGKLPIVLVGCLIWSSGHGNESGLQFRAGLSGAQVSPSPVQTRARGKALFFVAADFSRVTYRLRLRNGTNLTAAHLHCAPAGIAGPVIADLLGPVAGGWSGRLDIAAALTAANLIQGADCVSTIGKSIVDLADLAGAMASRQVYVDVRSTAFPEGEVRGQTKVFIPPVATSTSRTSGASSGTTKPAVRISVTSTPTLPVAFPVSGTIPITLGTTFRPSFIPGPATVLVPTGTFNVPISFLGTPSTAFTPTNLVLTIPDLSLSVPGSSFTLPQVNFGLPPASFTLPTGFNPPFPTTTVAIPATAVTIPATVQTLFPSSVLPATATVNIPPATFTAGSPFPGNLAVTLVLSRGAPF